MDKLTQRVKDLAQSVGYVTCGITTSAPFMDYASALENRVKRFPSTQELYRPMYSRIDPISHAPWVRSVIVCIRWYGKYYVRGKVPLGIGRTYLFDRRNPACPDHTMPKRMKDGLRRLGLRVKIGGVPARAAAVRAGVARFGRNCFVFVGKYGSWVNVETFLVDSELTPDKPATEIACPPGCKHCLRSCPTGAIVAPGIMRMDRCIAYLTYSAPEPIAPDLWQKMGYWVYGCDRCQEVCPLNHGSWHPCERALWLEPLLPYLSANSLALMDDETYRKIVYPALWYIPQDQPDRWRRNAQRALQLVSSDCSQ